MLRNYLKTAIRNLRKQTTHSIINIVGLAIGMAVFILIFSYVWFEMSFDRFHGKADLIYRVVQTYIEGGQEYHEACTGNMLAQALEAEYPEIAHITRLGSWRDVDLHYKDNITITKRGEEYLRADPSIFDVFDIRLLNGDPARALDDPNSIILTEELALELYGDEDPMGKVISITLANFQERAFNNPNTEFEVTGIAEGMPANSHFDFSFLIPYGEDWEEYYFATNLGTYIVLQEDYPPELLEEKFPGIIRKYFGPEFEDTYGTSYVEWMKSGGIHQLHLQPLKKVHLDSYFTGEYVNVRKGNMNYVYFLSVISFFILLLACTNFILMSVARSASRTKEVGIHKVAGASKVHLIWRFLLESILLSILALILSIILVYLLLPSFNNLVDRQLSPLFSSFGFGLFKLLVFALFVGLVAGSFPAFILSSLQPIGGLKGGKIRKPTSRHNLINGLITVQSIISITLIVASLIVSKQLFFMQRKDPGFDIEQIVVIRIGDDLLKSDMGSEVDERGYSYYREQRFSIPQTFKQEILKHPHVVYATVGRPVPGGNGFNWWMECQPEGAHENQEYQIRWIGADPDYIETFGLRLIAGRNYSTLISPMAPDSPEGIVLNETAVKYFGWMEPLGKNISYKGTIVTYSGDGKTNYSYVDIKAPVIGIVEDFHFKSLHTEIQPLGIWPGGLRFISVKIQPFDVPGTLEFFEKTWKEFVPEVPFEYAFLDESLDELYLKERRLIKIFLYFTIIAISIACLGLFGLAAFTTQQRTKEIGVRKVMGASFQDIIKLLSITYSKLLIIGNLIAWSLGYIAMDRWLRNFAYRTNIGVGVFLVTGLLSLILVLIAVSSQTIKVSLTDPADSLRYE